MTITISDYLNKDTKQTPKMQHFWLVVLLIIAFSSLIKLPTFNLPHKEGDEIAFWYLAKNWVETGKYTLQGSILSKTKLYQDRANREMPVHPPIFPALLRPFVQYNIPDKAVMASWLGHFLAILAVALIGRFLFLSYGLTHSAFSPLFWLPLLGIATDPIMTWISGILWIDNLHAGWAALSVAFVMMASTSSNRKLMYVFAGIILGIALLSKVTSSIIIPIIIFIIFVNELDNKKRIQALLLGAIPAVVLALSWYIPLYITMGEFLFPKPTAETQAMLDQMSPEELKAHKESTRCTFCEASANSPWYYLFAKLPLIAPLFIIAIGFYILFYITYIKTQEWRTRLKFFIPLIWCFFILIAATYKHAFIQRRITILVASIYIMFYFLIVYSEKYPALRKYQNLLLFIGTIAIIYGAIGGGYYLFNGNYAEFFSMPELMGIVKLWGANG